MGKTQRLSSEWLKIVCILVFLVVVFLVAFLLLDSYLQTTFSRDFTPELTAALLGVLMALSLEHWLSSMKEEKYADSMKSLVAQELEKMKGAAEEGKGNFLETQVWDSLLHSGTVSHLEADVRKKLFELYAHAHALDIETMRERDATVASTTDRSSAEKLRLAMSLGERNRAKEKNIIEMIDSLLSSGGLKTG